MAEKKPNKSVKCSVNSCKNHCGEKDYCSLDCVCIGTHETDPAMDQCTDCRSFVNIDPAEQEKAAERWRNSAIFENNE